jgi:hypothetical protein
LEEGMGMYGFHQAVSEKISGIEKVVSGNFNNWFERNFCFSLSQNAPRNPNFIL